MFSQADWEVTDLLSREIEAAPIDVSFGSSDIVIVSERAHNSESIQKRNIDLMAKLIKSITGNVCFFSEFPSDTAQLINKFQNEDQPYASTIGRYFEEESAKKHGATLNLLPSNIAEFLKSEQVEIIPVDHKTSPGLVKRYFDAATGDSETYAKISIEERNRIFVMNIHQAMQTRKCDKAILLVGDDHTRRELGGEHPCKCGLPSSPIHRITPMQEYLVTKGYGTKVYRVSLEEVVFESQLQPKK